MLAAGLMMRGRRSGFNSNQLINQSLIRPQALITVDCHPESAEYNIYIYDYRRRRGAECSLQNKNHWLNYDLILKVRILSFKALCLNSFYYYLCFCIFASNDTLQDERVVITENALPGRKKQKSASVLR